MQSQNRLSLRKEHKSLENVLRDERQRDLNFICHFLQDLIKDGLAEYCVWAAAHHA